MKNMTRQEFVASLRRKSSGFSSGASIYRGVTRHHQHGRWQARIGRVAGNKDLYLGTFSTQEEAAEAYDIAAIKFRGLNAVTNFDMSRYDVKSIVNSNLPIGGITTKAKASESSSSDTKSVESKLIFDDSFAAHSSSLSFAVPIKPDPQDYWSLLALHNQTQNSSKNNNNLFQSSGNSSAFHSLSNFNLDFSTSTAVDHSNGVLNGGMIQQQTPSTIPFATPISVTSSYDSSSYGSWATPSIHPYQAAKPNLAVYHSSPRLQFIHAIVFPTKIELDDNLLLVASSDGNVHIWKDYTSKGEQKLVTAFSSVQGHRPSVLSVNVVVDWQQQSGYLYASGEISSIMLWDLDKEQLVSSISSSSESSISALSASQVHGGQFAAGYADLWAVCSIQLQDGKTPLDLSLCFGRDFKSYELAKLLKLVPADREA
ncbi:AP2-like ethylene-responsive transcription factor AIL5 [Magnolia sinica]|uniref:AP2-like ethylene-responsive transcription factor AIL5 n=1 Tax=Magnolia sinica TaxID=86752 RepID=UPI002658B662|nr:AP2-like ethylene-responsive transcription factor AIL5 [Magnolia sinica]